LQVTITNLYNDVIPEKSEFIADHGQSFLIEFPDKKVLFDTGMNGPKLLHNMKQLQIDPNSIDVLVLSHGHLDHTGGVKALLRNRSSENPLEIIGHPTVFEPKGMYNAKKTPNVTEFYLPPIEEELQEKMLLNLTVNPVKIHPNLMTVGEVKARPHKDGVENRTRHFVDGNWEHDRLLDDLSLVLKTKNGLVLICGCCHAGLLNTLEQVTRIFPEENINTIIGGTHMLYFNEEEVDFVAGQLMNKYSSPKLYFNHCSGQNTIDRLQTQIKSDVIRPCLVGTKIEFEY
jgi:7,8-dihydropterin-6-yl-methyl-4-(beta-D-ribofuranosyl)aminobenzene 5'-phosphate synthase